LPDFDTLSSRREYDGRVEIGPYDGEGAEISKVEAFVFGNRAGVLERAIDALKAASVSQLPAVSHRISGSLSLYGFKKEGDLARVYYEWLSTASAPEGDEAIVRRDSLLNALRSAAE
jgi:hypothetical protein